MDSASPLTTEQQAMPVTPWSRGESPSSDPAPRVEQEITLELETVPSNDDDSQQLQMQRWWQESITKTMGAQNGYKHVSVLLVKWQEEFDQLKVDPELSELRSVFKDKYGYATKTSELSLCRNPQMQLLNAISGFIIDNDDPQTLLIVYYAGHGIFHNNEKRLELAGSEDPKDGVLSKVFWNEVQNLFVEHTAGDVLAIMDCCFASNLMARTGSSSSDSKVNSRAFEMLAASTIDKLTESPGDQSFTRALVRCLNERAERCGRGSEEELLYGEPGEGSFDTHELSQAIDQVRTRTPCRLWGVLKGNRRHIRLTPLTARKEQERQQAAASSSSGDDQTAAVPPPPTWTFDPPGGLLSLQFVLQDKALTKETITSLTRQLPTVFRDSNIRLRNIRWLDFERPKLFPRFTGIVQKVHRFKSVGSKRKASAAMLTPAEEGEEEEGLLRVEKKRSSRASDLRAFVGRRMQFVDQDIPTSGDESAACNTSSMALVIIVLILLFHCTWVWKICFIRG